MQFLKTKIFYISTGDIKLLYLKGEIMGLDGVQNFDDDTFGYGYIKTGKPLFNGEEPTEQVTATTNVTVPVGQVKKDPTEQPLTGLEVESDPTKTAVNQVTTPTVTEPAANDPKYRVFAERTITDDASFKAAEDEALKGYQLMKSKGDLDLSDEEISKQAKLYAENVRNQENFDNTVVFYDKAEYKAAEAERQKAYDQLYEQYRNQGLSRKEARRKANNELVHNEYLGKRLFGNSARSFVTKNQDLFFENGKFSDKKYHDFVLGNANIATEEDEVDNYTYNLKERRTATEYLRTKGRKTNVTQQGRVAKEANMKTERNNTALYRGLFFGGMIGVGIGTGALLGGISSTAVAGSVSASEAGAAAGTAAAAGATANAAAGATASAYISGELLGGVAGAGLGGGLLSLIRDKGNKIKHIKEIKDYTPVVPPEPEPTPEPEPEPEPQPQPCPTQEWDEKVCTHTVIPGSSWAYYAEKSGITINGQKPAGKMLNSYLYAQQLMYGLENPKGLRETRFLPVGAEYVQHSDFSKLFNDNDIMRQYGIQLNPLKDAQINVDNCVELNGKVKGRRNPHYRFGGFVRGNTQIAHYSQDCHQNLPVVTYR